MDVSFIVVANPVKCSASFSSGWTTTALVEVDSIKALKKHSVEEEQDPAGVPLVPEGEEEGAAVGAQMNRPPPEKEKQENAGIAVKKVQLFFSFSVRVFTCQLLIAGHTRNRCPDIE